MLIAAALGLLWTWLPEVTAAGGERSAFRVCADGNYLPYSHRNGGGFENRIAEIIAADLGLPVEYTWFPQRMGFIRNTLRAKGPDGKSYKCDVVMGLPHGYELAITTDPYYWSTYALVYVAGRGLDDVSSAADLLQMAPERRAKLRIGVHERNPGSVWLAKHELLDQLVPYVAQPGDPEVGPGDLESADLLAGRIDATILWGPIAGHLARRSRDAEVRVIPLASEPGVRFHYAIAVGVRFGEGEWKQQLNGLLQANAAAIERVLREFDVPRVTAEGKLLPVDP